MENAERTRLRFLIQSLLDAVGITDKLQDTTYGFVIWDRDVYVELLGAGNNKKVFQCYWKSVIVSSSNEALNGTYQTKVESETDNIVTAAENFVSMIISLDILVALEGAFNKLSAFEASGNDMETATQKDIQNFKMPE